MERILEGARARGRSGQRPGTWLRCSALLLGAALARSACGQAAGLPGSLNSPDVSHLPDLPDSPGAMLQMSGVNQPDLPSDAAAEDTAADAPGQHDGKPPVCGTAAAGGSGATATTQQPCRAENQVQPFLSARPSAPLTSEQKGKLAIRDTIDPFNLLTIVGYSAFAIGFNAHSAFGPGLKGWGKLSGYSFVEDAQGEFSGTFLISSLTHEDPRYHRMAHGPVKQRILHAVEHSYWTRHDDGTPMPNYAVLLTYPISAELSNLYVPGVQTNSASTARRIGIGLATDPSGTIVAEFLPDIAKRIHIHVIFIQEILNQVVTGGTAPNVQ